MEGSAAFVSIVSEALALAADTDEDTWLERLESMSYLSMKDLAEAYADGSATLSDSAAESLLMSQYGDAAAKLAEDYYTVQSELLWYQSYLSINKLERGANETPEAYGDRVSSYFDALKTDQAERYYAECERFYTTASLYGMLYSIGYEGDWGETLGDFFLPPEDAEAPENEAATFLPFAVAMSDGQRAGLRYLTLMSLLTTCIGNEEAAKTAYNSIRDPLAEIDTVSIYDGVNRAIFRDCVALTSRASMEAHMGNNPYGHATTLSTLELVGFAVLTILGTAGLIGSGVLAINPIFGGLEEATTYLDSQLLAFGDGIVSEKGVLAAKKAVSSAKLRIGFGTILYAVSLAMITFAVIAFMEWQKQIYGVEFTKIPLMIVDEADIVTYVTDENGDPVYDEKGEQKRNIEFNQFVYYDVVKCNRPDFNNSEANVAVYRDYKNWGCMDAADLNADLGRQWLCLYTTKDPGKGDPILADSLTYQTGSDAMPAGCSQGLHFFTYTYAMDIADMAYAYNNDVNGMYFFWDTDENAFTASAFTGSQLALAGIGGLAVGILGATAVMLLTKKKKDTPDAPVAA